MRAIQLRDDLIKELLAVSLHITPSDIRILGVQLEMHHETVRRYLKGEIGLNIQRGEEILSEAIELIAKNKKTEEQKQLLLTA